MFHIIIVSLLFRTLREILVIILHFIDSSDLFCCGLQEMDIEAIETGYILLPYVNAGRHTLEF